MNLGFSLSFFELTSLGCLTGPTGPEPAGVEDVRIAGDAPVIGSHRIEYQPSEAVSLWPSADSAPDLGTGAPDEAVVSRADVEVRPPVFLDLDNGAQADSALLDAGLCSTGRLASYERDPDSLLWLRSASPANDDGSHLTRAVTSAATTSDRAVLHSTLPQALITQSSAIRALRGTPANPGVASANVGQEIGLQLTGATTTTRLVFPTISSAGTKNTRPVAPSRIDTNTGTAFFLVPADAATGQVTVTGAQAAPFQLQIVPTLVDVDQGVNDRYFGGALRLRGSGFIEGDVSVHFGGQSLADTGVSGGINVGFFYSQENDGLNLTVPEGAGFGPIVVRTSGGSSEAFALSFDRLTGLAQSGTPANSSLPSANPGQAVMLEGQGFDASTDVVFMTVDDAGMTSQKVVRPSAVNASGTQLRVIVPVDAISAVVGVIGDRNNTQALLQVVPLLTSATLTSLRSLQLRGTGFVEGHGTTYLVGTGKISDSSPATQGINVGFFFSQPNDGVNLPLPSGGPGEVRVRTLGGTSAAVPWNVISPQLSELYDVAVQPSSGAVWVATNTAIQSLNPLSGEVLASFILPGGNSNTTGLQFLTAPITLNAVTAPAGSLLITNGDSSFDKIFALDPTTGSILATLDLRQNIDPVAGLFDPVTGHLFLLDQSPNEVVEINLADGAIIGRFAAPFDIFYGGLALHPVTGNLWIGSSQSKEVAEVTKSGALVRKIDLSGEGMGNEISGLAFNLSGQLLVSSNRGAIYVIDISVAAP